MDHYDALELTPSAPPEEIRAAYLKLARRYHPDSHPDAAPADRRRNEQRMQEVTAAWAVLGDTSRRRAYDDQRPQPTRTRSRPSATGSADDPYRFVPFDLDDDPPMPDTDPEGRRTHSRGLSMAPVLLLMAAVGCLIVGAMTGLAPLLALGLASFVASIVLFIVVPLVALTSSQRGDRL